MIKGARKNAVIIKNTGSEIFEQAIFIVRADVPPLSDYTLRSEALRLVDENTDAVVKKKKRAR